MASYIENLRFSDRNASDIGADDGLPPYNNDTFTTTYTETKSCAIGKDGIRINYDLDTATPKYFEMTKDGVVFAETGQPTYTTGLGRLCAVQQAFQAVELPPNSTTLKINDTVLVSAGVANQTTTINDGNITIQGTGLNNNPLLSLNTGTGNGVLYQEVYNQRTAQTGEFSRMSFYAKNSTGTKTEYARIHQNAPVITAGSVKGRIDFAVGNGAGLQDYLSLNANTSQVDILNSDLHLNANDILNVSSITTPLNNKYSKENVVYLNANTSITTNVEDNLRYVAVNCGKVPSWQQATSITTTGFLSLENITASCLSFAGAWWVGTEAGNVYYTVDSGATWTLVYSFGAKINCLVPYNSGSYLAVGGQFSLGTGSYNYIAGIDTSYNVFDITSGNSGLNGEVKTLYENTSNSCLYIGGSFDDWWGGSTAQFSKFLIYSYGAVQFYALNNNGGAGFLGGDVLTITRDNNSGFIIVGGSFTDSNIGGGGLGIGYLFTFQTTLGYDVSSYFSIGANLGSAVNTLELYSAGVVVGGDFSNPLTHPSWTDSYGIYMTWNGTNWDLNNFPFFSPSFPINYITYLSPVGTYYTITNNNILYQASTQLLSIPIGSAWKCISFNGSITVFATNAQTTAGFLFYYYDQNVGITITSGATTFNDYSMQGATNCLLLGTGASVEMIYRTSTANWWVISRNGANFS